MYGLGTRVVGYGGIFGVLFINVFSFSFGFYFVEGIYVIFYAFYLK